MSFYLLRIYSRLFQ